MACTGHSQDQDDAEQSICISPDGWTLIRAGVWVIPAGDLCLDSGRMIQRYKRVPHIILLP